MSSAPAPSTPFVPRNVVVLSDGTGNSSAKLFKTNVWRIYDALDLTQADQVALYDDGVGSASFKPLAVLGGAFGFGLKRNVLDLYTFLCRNYRVDAAAFASNPKDAASHDRIFAFGFSRGAFTARVVAALVAHEGLVQASGADLRRKAAWAYRVYRASRYRHSIGVRLLRSLRDLMLRLKERVFRQSAYDAGQNRRVDIDFVGVWDTVAAYGLPIDELTRGYDRWIWPMLPKDRTLSPRVLRACHALALDDERQTFYPLLWDEKHEQQAGNTTSTAVGQERISQVWFTGMHSDVGGGYPDDTLAHTPLRWIATQAAARGLRFLNTPPGAAGGIPIAWIDRSVPCAPIHDSRRGAGAYYRYHPRPVERLCADTDADVVVARPKIHESVFQRLRGALDDYATIVLPERYAVVTAGGDILHGDASATPAPPRPNPYEASSQSLSRRRRQEHVYNAVWWRRVAYFLTLGATLSTLLRPLWHGPDPLGVLAGRHHWLGVGVGALGALVPSFMDGWLQYYRDNPLQLLLGGGAIGILLWWSGFLEQPLRDRMRAVWADGGFRAATVQPAPAPADPVYRLRTSAAYRGLFRLFSFHVWPNLFGLAILFVLAGVLPVRIAFDVTSRAEGLPACATTPQRASSDTADTFAFWPSLLCNATGVTAVRGETYRLDIAPPEACPADQPPTVRRVGRWSDASVPVPGLDGFTAGDRLRDGWRGLVFVAATPLKRILYADWFVPIASIDPVLPERHPLTSPSTSIVAGRDGALMLYVNDATVPLPGWDALYANNAGGPARVRITRGAKTPPLAQALEPYSCEEQAALAGALGSAR